jgi:hypothetical protein
MATPEFNTENPKEQELLLKLDTLAADMSETNFEFGWTAEELWHVTQEDFMQENDGKERKAYSAFITLVSQREAKDIESRNIIGDRIRVARFVPRDVYAKIEGASLDAQGNKISPKFHQIRNCLFVKGSNVDEGKTEAMIDWCVQNQWPPVADIREHRGVVDPKVAVDPVAKHKSLFVKLSQKIMAEVPEGSVWYNVSKVVFEAWKAESGITPES